jgi:hypothetical protein
MTKLKKNLKHLRSLGTLLGRKEKIAFICDNIFPFLQLIIGISKHFWVFFSCFVCCICLLVWDRVLLCSSDHFELTTLLP